MELEEASVAAAEDSADIAARAAREATARLEIALFLVFLLATSGVFYALLLFAEGTAERWLGSYSAVFMWCPAFAALLTCLLLKRSVRGLGWGWGGAKSYVVAYGLPLLFGIPAYAAVWLGGAGELDPTRLWELRAKVGLPEGALGVAGLALLVLFAAPLGVVSTLGEEIGWRGFLVPRLAALFGLRRTSLIVGLLWAVWHYPLIWTVVPHLLPELRLWLGAACFSVMLVALSGVYTWLRMVSDSVFPPALLHATSNAFVVALEAMTRHHTSLFSHEYGLSLAIAIPIVCWPFWRRLNRRGPQLTCEVRQDAARP